MPQTPQERRRAQRRLATQIREGTYEPSRIGRFAREAARDAAGHQAREAAHILREHQADDAWYLAEQKMGEGPVHVYGPPVRSSAPGNPRISMMEYWREARMVKVYWGDGGTPYVFLEIDPPAWMRWRLSASPGKFINRTLAGKPYMPAPF